MKRSSGVLMHISSLWGEYSIGSFGKEAKEWIDFLSASGFGVWQVLPFCIPDDCNSPYKSFSAFSINPLFIDLPTLQEEGLITKEELVAAKQKTPYACEFTRLKEERFALLSMAASRVKDRSAVTEFCKIHPKTDEFCRFMTLKKKNGETEWNLWKHTELLEEDALLFAWRFTQYKAHCQWEKIKDYANKRGVSIIGDVPIYVAYDSADVYYHREMFLLDEAGHSSEVAGVPPDYFSADGQLWGNPLYHWKRMKSDGYAWWCDRIRENCELFDGVRIDHFRGLESYYAIPAGEKTAKNGVWKEGPGMDFIRAIQPICKEKLMIAEDLGVITNEVRALVEESGFPGMKVLQFGFLGEENSPHMPHNYIENCVAYTGTHDNNTLLGYVWEMTEEQRKTLLEYCGYQGEDWNQSYNQILKMMFASHAGLLILPVQDLLLYGRDTRLNIPGKSEGNWSYRITKEQLLSIDWKKFARWNALYGRKNVPSII